MLVNTVIKCYFDNYYKSPRLKRIAFVIPLLAASALVFAQQKTFDITAFGAVGDGKTLNTVSIQQAIDKAGAAGGGRVIVPKGRFVSGVIYIKSGVELYMFEDDVLLGSTHRLDYGKERVEALITARGQQNIALTGRGEIDGRGREVVKDLFRLLREGFLQDPQWKLKRPSEQSRPGIIAFDDCKNITVKGVTIKNAAGWVQDYARCNNVTIDSITVSSTEYWNNDGIDIVNCHDVSITRCTIDAADDGICLKSEGAPGWCENISVSNCSLRSSASAFKLGTGSRGGFKNIKVRNLDIFDTYRSAIALEAVDGGFIDGVDIQGVRAVTTGNALFIRLGHRNTDTGYSTIKNIHVSGLTVHVPAHKPDVGYPVEGPPLKYPHNVFPSSITGIPGHPVQNIALDNIHIIYEGSASKDIACFNPDTLQNVPERVPDYPEFSMFGELPCWGLYVRHAEGLTLQNVQLGLTGSDFRTAVIMDDVKQLRLEGLNIPANSPLPVLLLNNVPAPVLNKLQLPADNNKAIGIQ